MNFQVVMRLIAQWSGTLKFFPSDPEARIGIAEEIVQMASDEDQVRWLVRRLPKLYQEWPAMREVRAVFCSRYRAADGIDVYSCVYLDGIPADPGIDRARLETRAPAQLAGPVESKTLQPTDALFFLAEAAARKKRINAAATPTAAEIEAIKAQQERNRACQVAHVAQ